VLDDVRDLGVAVAGGVLEVVNHVTLCI
jgi:hypothetical protein